jgi:uncharacterized NAD(P)/FAD-binding protein YdhS
MTTNYQNPTIAIIGGGFCGNMLAVHLLSNAKSPLHIVLINAGYPLSRGIAYSSYSQKHLLNVPAKSMSAFPDKPNHFMDWIRKHENYGVIDQTALPTMFLPRNIYGHYLKDIFDTAIRKKPDYVSISFVHDEAIDIEEFDGKAHVYFSVSPGVAADKVVLAIGNSAPDNPNLKDNSIYSSKNYFGNPWLHEAVNHLDQDREVFILGNGLTMVDIVLGLKEKKHRGKIYSLSPNGFQILPHRNFAPYVELVEELKPPYDLPKIISLFRSHVKKLRDQGHSAEAAVDSLRPYTQKVWQSWSKQEKERFMYHIRHMWGVARHRLPMEIHKLIQQLILDDKLEIIAGRIQSMIETERGIRVTFKRRRDQKIYEVAAARVINCTGPLSDINKLERPLVKNLISRKMIHADEMKLGIDALPDGTILNDDKTPSPYLSTIGSLLRGLLWESTAVPELREQAKTLSEKLLKELGDH